MLAKTARIRIAVTGESDLRSGRLGLLYSNEMADIPKMRNLAMMEAFVPGNETKSFGNTLRSIAVERCPNLVVLTPIGAYAKLSATWERGEGGCHLD